MACARVRRRLGVHYLSDAAKLPGCGIDVLPPAQRHGLAAQRRRRRTEIATPPLAGRRGREPETRMFI